MLETFRQFGSEFPWFFPAFAFVFGSIVGSFLNVCIYRIPAGKSIVHPGSTCACGQPIAWFDNIPILSWFILRGKARCCGQPYSFRYPAIEFLTGGLFLAAWLQYPPIQAACLMTLIAMLVCATFIDLDHMEIPDRFSIGLAIVGFALSLFVPTLHVSDPNAYAIASLNSGLVSMIGILVGSGVILWIGILADKILNKEALGFGDVKLLGGIGAFLGWQGAIFSIFGGALVGCFGVLIVLIYRKIAPKKTDSEESEQLIGLQVPFGPMLSAGALLYALALRSPVNLYFAEVAKLFTTLH